MSGLRPAEKHLRQAIHSTGKIRVPRAISFRCDPRSSRLRNQIGLEPQPRASKHGLERIYHETSASHGRTMSASQSDQKLVGCPSIVLALM